MTEPLARRFAEVASMLEDMHAIAIEGQVTGNAPDMSAALSGQLRRGFGSLRLILRDINRELATAAARDQKIAAHAVKRRAHAASAGAVEP